MLMLYTHSVPHHIYLRKDNELLFFAFFSNLVYIYEYKLKAFVMRFSFPVDVMWVYNETCTVEKLYF